MKTVFLSSVARGLESHRQAARDAINGLDGYTCVGMEDFGARPDPPLEVCLAKLKECDIFVCILGHRYGSCPPGREKSYTEIEFDTAIELKKPRLVFVAPEDETVPYNLIESDSQRELHRKFRSRAMDGGGVHVSFFRNPDHLEASIAKGLSNLKSSIHKAVQKKAVELETTGRVKVPQGAILTILLFQFVSNRGGFDTGFAVANVSSDPFGTERRNGHIQISYSGEMDGGGCPSRQRSMLPIEAGSCAKFTLSSGGTHGIAAVPTFEGYMIVECPFAAHGVALFSGIGAGGRGNPISFIPATIIGGGPPTIPLP